MSNKHSAASPATIVGVERRRAFIFVDDEEHAESRFAFALNGEPVRPIRITAHKQGFIRGLNLIANGQFDEPVLPWRAIGDPAPVFGRNLSPQWTLHGRNTAYFCASAGAPALLEYASADSDGLIPVIEGEDYNFSGYFGVHRCAASVRIDLLDADETVIASLREPVPMMSGGQSLDKYAKIEIGIHIFPRCSHLRLQLSIDQHLAAGDQPDSAAYMFFTQLALRMSGESSIDWKPDRLSADQAVALSRGATILDVTLPRIASGSIAPEATFDVIDTRTGIPARNSPFSVPAAPDLTFAVSSFDGVTLTGEISEIAERRRIELIIDGAVATHIDVDAMVTDTSRTVSLRIPDDFLDGAPHVLELRDGASGATLFLNAVTLKSLVVPWELVDDLHRFALPIELHPLARRRYQCLLAHIGEHGRRKTSEIAPSLQQLGLCHDILSQKAAGHLDDEILRVPRSDDPEASIVVCTSDLGSFRATAAALILAHNVSRYEVIVSTDDTSLLDEVRASVTGVTFIASKERVGRAHLANKGVAAARSAHVVLLETPCEPGAHWLDELINAFRLFDGVGLAGCKLVKPNGRLLHAGGVLWSSGTRQAVGANGNAEHPQVNYARQVDYVSGGALMVRKDVWDEVGGMTDDLADPVLEDIDLALKVRSRGRKVVYAPHAVVTVDPSATRQRASGSLPIEFKRRWADMLRNQPAETSARQTMDHGIKDRVLFIDQQIPRTDVDAGSYAAIQEIRLFQALGYKVTFLPLNLAYFDVYARAIERIGVEVIHAPFATSVEGVIKERGSEFNIVYITRYQVARAVLPYVRRFNPAARIIFNNADLHFLRELRAALAAKDAELLRRSTLTRDRELEVMRQADLTISYNEVEHAVIQSHNLDQTRIAKAPWVVKCSGSIPPFSARAHIGFLGSFGHRPNVEAATFFSTKVMPFMRQRMPDVSLMIYGSQIGPEIEDLACDNVVIKGHVADLADAFDQMRVFVAPLTAGAGIKGKVLNAMAFGVPTVLSPTAAEGIGVQPGIHYLGAAAPDEWVSALGALYTDEKTWNRISRDALNFVKENYSHEQGIEKMRAALEMINVFPARKPDALCCKELLPPLM